MVDQRSLGGCPPPTDETGTSKLHRGAFAFDTVFDSGILTTANDKGVFTDVNWVAAAEGSDDEVWDWPEISDMPDHFFYYCFNIDLIATKDNLWAYRGCAVARTL